MLEAFFKALKANTLPAIVKANDLDYVLHGGSYCPADDKEVVAARNKNLIKEREIDSELQILATKQNIEVKNRELEIEKELQPINLEFRKLDLEMKLTDLKSANENKELFAEIKKIEAEYKVENAKNQLRDLKPTRKEEFSSLVSFVEFIKHDSGKYNATGNNYFIMLNNNGGKFITDFERPKDIFFFKRRFSEVYKRLSQLSEGRTVNQKALLDFVLENKHYINNFAEVFNCYKKIKQTKSSKFDSEPILTSEGAAEERFEVAQAWEFDGRQQRETLTLIPLINLSIPVVYMGEPKYKIEIYITPMKGPEDSMLFEIFAPGIEYTLLEALQDELNFAKNELKDLTEAYIALDN